MGRSRMVYGKKFTIVLLVFITGINFISIKIYLAPKFFSIVPQLTVSILLSQSLSTC